MAVEQHFLELAPKAAANQPAGIAVGEHDRTDLLLGLLMAGAATAATRSELDLAPGSPPGPLIAVPTGVLLAILAVVAGVAAASSTFAHVRADRAKPGEVLRTA